MGSNAVLRCFVSYSRKDARWLERLQVHLTPLIHAGTLELWDDTKIKSGEPWREELEAALSRARVAVLLITADFLASRFIKDNELQPLLARAASQDVRVIPVLVGSSGFMQSDLSHYECVGLPERPLNKMSKADAEAELARLAQTIAEHALKTQQPATPPPRTEYRTAPHTAPVPRRGSPSHNSDRGELTVHIQLHQGLLHRTIHTEFQASDLPPLPLAQVQRDGSALFELLFGADVGRWSEALKPLFPEQQVIPSRHPVRVRIWTEVAELLGLPWGLTAYKGSPLREHGWTFELTDRQVAEGERRLRLPTGVLVILPGLATGAQDNLGSEVHRQALQEVFESYYLESTRNPKQFAFAYTREEAIAALHAVKPQIIYYYGLGQGGDNPGLAVPSRTSGPAQVWSAHNLQHAIVDSQAPVEVIYLNGRTDTPGGLAGLGLRLLSVAAAVVTPASAVSSSDKASDGETANRWFRRLLGDEAEPAIAAFLMEPLVDPEKTEAAQKPPAFWLPVTVLTRYRTFLVERRRPLEWRPRRGSDFDRHRQRKVAFTDLVELVRHPTRKAQVFLTVGPPKNHHEDVALQLHRYAEDLDENGDLQIGKPVSLGATFRGGVDLDDEHLFAKMVGELNVFLGGQWDTPLTSSLQSVAPPKSKAKKRVLWLDWGVIRHLPMSDDVRAWLGFLAARIVPAIPGGLHVIITLAAEAPSELLAELTTVFRSLVNRPDFRSDQLRCYVLDPLGPADIGEILEFLEATSCPSNLREELAELLYAVTQGEYSPMRQWIDRALGSSWVEIAEPLRCAARNTTKTKKLV